MSKQNPSKWIPFEVEGEQFSLINFDRKSIGYLIMDEMDTGFDVYYNTRWGLTTNFAEWLSQNSELVNNRKVLIIGAGAGLETLILAKYAQQIVINDLSEVSLRLCKEQLEQNNFHNFSFLPGDYTSIDLPKNCELAIACYPIYCPATAKAMEAFINRFDGDVIVVNEPLKAFRKFLKTTRKTYETLKQWDVGVALKFLRST